MYCEGMSIPLKRQGLLAANLYDLVVSAEPLDLDSSAVASLADKAYVAIRDRLIMLDIRPGDPIDDDELAKDLGVGRTPVREALKRLEGDRLVVSYSRRGAFATGMDISDLAHISEIRAQLEPLAARRAAERASRVGHAERAHARGRRHGRRHRRRSPAAAPRARRRAHRPWAIDRGTGRRCASPGCRSG